MKGKATWNKTQQTNITVAFGVRIKHRYVYFMNRFHIPNII